MYMCIVFFGMCVKKTKPDSNASMPILSQASLKPLALEQAKRFASMFLGGAMPWDAHGEAYEIITYDFISPPWSSLVLLGPPCLRLVFGIVTIVDS